MKHTMRLLFFLATLLLTFALQAQVNKGLIESQSIWGLGPPPADHSNQFQFNSTAIELGEKLFFDQGLSHNDKVACASCHVTSNAFFANESIPAQGARKFRATMQITGAAYGRFYFWDGRSDSLWSQALGPLENPKEHNIDRATAATHAIDLYQPLLIKLSNIDASISSDIATINSHPEHNQVNTNPLLADAVNRIFVVIGKAIAAFETTILPPKSEWDLIAKKLLDDQSLSTTEASVYDGFKLFTSSKTRCSTCHTGPLFTDHAFHNTALPIKAELGVEPGRYGTLPTLKHSEFGCLSKYSDASENDCQHLLYLPTEPEETFGAFKTPTLRGLKHKTAFGHAGQFINLEQVLDHYQSAPQGAHGRMFGQSSFSELQPVQLSESEREALLSFLRAL